MEALKFETSADLDEALAYDERLELINGVIIKRPLPRSRHGKAQGEVFGELRPYNRKKVVIMMRAGFFLPKLMFNTMNFNVLPMMSLAGKNPDYPYCQIKPS